MLALVQWFLAAMDWYYLFGFSEKMLSVGVFDKSA